MAPRTPAGDGAPRAPEIIPRRHPRVKGLTCKCGRPVDGRTWCARCEHTVDVALVNIAAYYADLELAETRRKAIRYDLPRGKGANKSMPMVVDARFLPDGKGHEARQAARNTITTWVRVCLEEWPATKMPRDNIAACCGYLQALLPRIAVARWADELKDDLLDTERALLRVDARGPERIFAGLCTVCLVAFDRTPLYAFPGDEYVTCPAVDCGMAYRVEDRRNLMIDALEYEWMTAAKIADLHAYLRLIGDREWVRKKLDRWKNTGDLEPASIDEQGRPLYPFGQVRQMLLEADARRQERQRDTRTRA